MLGPGDPCPDVTVWRAPREPVAVRELGEGGATLLLFYLFDWSSTWTDELTLLRDRRAEFEQAGTRVFGVSRDSPYTHAAWAHALDLDVPLLSDWNGDAVRGFGVAHEYRGLRDVAERSAFLIDPGGTVRGAWGYRSGEVPDFDELLAGARALPRSP